MTYSPRVVCFPFVGDDIGGSHLSTIKLIEALDRKRYTPLVVLHTSEGPVASVLAEHGLPFVEAPFRPLPSRRGVGNRTVKALRNLVGFTLAAARPLARFLKERDVDIVHTNDGRIHLAWAVPAKLAHAHHVWHHRGDPNAWGINYLAPIFADRIVTVSRFATPRRPLLPFGCEVAVVHSPFDPPSTNMERSVAKNPIREELGCSPETRLLGYFGLLISRKRPLGFVEAVAAFTRRYPDVPVIGLLFGVPGNEEAWLGRAVMQRATELGIADRIRLMGFRQPVEPWMGAVDVLLVPAVREPFGRTLIEAMMLGVPVVATRDGGNCEAIENEKTGFLVPVDRPEAFCEPVHRLLTDPECHRRITMAAYEDTRSRYGLKKHVEQIDRIYSQLGGPFAEPRPLTVC
ncbi:glycosyltransferase family 4 protein [Pararhizobium mangrovi]|uniref:Glycosyltransferase family 4 protein n=1 Tax=Pararhizobium mangrovi TaxID=2590452 RepID=A0A506U588_9HYPH|nr:glycosyltransferase family 4 protein [Pararhizobium mangrovi]TPW29020.1 glycosyltransferase family 4 protein [Pararhizobium mangrovi]